MTKWYNRVGNTIEMCVDGKWIKGIVVKGERSFDGIINMETLTGQHCWCGCGGEGVHFRKCDDSDGDLITNADRIRTMSDDKLADFLDSVFNNIFDGYEFPCEDCRERINCDVCFKEWLQSEVTP